MNLLANSWLLLICYPANGFPFSLFSFVWDIGIEITLIESIEHWLPY